MLLAGIQANLGLDPRLKHSGVTTWGKVIRGPLDTPQLAEGDSFGESAGFFAISSAFIVKGI
jgi:hypothetical protein